MELTYLFVTHNSTTSRNFCCKKESFQLKISLLNMKKSEDTDREDFIFRTAFQHYEKLLMILLVNLLVFRVIQFQRL